MLLKVEKLNAFYGDVQVLHDISLEVNPGEVVAMVGANSAGKSTFLRCLSGIVKKSTGSIQFNGEELIGKPAYDVTHLGVVHIPEGRRMFPLMTVQENLEMGYYPQRASNTLSQRLEESYEMFPLLKRLKNQHAGSLSGGEQQMLAIARGLMAGPKLLTVDEPSLGLAPILVQSTFEILEKIRAAGVTIFLVEQNVMRALGMADRGYVLENGRVVMQGTGEELLADDHLKKAYMGM